MRIRKAITPLSGFECIASSCAPRFAVQIIDHVSSHHMTISHRFDSTSLIKSSNAAQEALDGSLRRPFMPAVESSRLLASAGWDRSHEADWYASALAMSKSAVLMVLLSSTSLAGTGGGWLDLVSVCVCKVDLAQLKAGYVGLIAFGGHCV
jgi:hypothetical protein